MIDEKLSYTLRNKYNNTINKYTKDIDNFMSKYIPLNNDHKNYDNACLLKNIIGDFIYFIIKIKPKIIYCKLRTFFYSNGEQYTVIAKIADYIQEIYGGYNQIYDFNYIDIVMFNNVDRELMAEAINSVRPLIKIDKIYFEIQYIDDMKNNNNIDYNNRIIGTYCALLDIISRSIMNELIISKSKLFEYFINNSAYKQIKDIIENEFKNEISSAPDENVINYYFGLSDDV